MVTARNPNISLFFQADKEIPKMNGCVIPKTPIAVDFWKVRDNPQAKVFFLTHLHGDHITGLTSSWEHTIYCSDVTAHLLQVRLGVKTSLICPLELNRAHVIYLDEEKEVQMTVTLVDAKHCPGAVMFVFEGYFGTILHTGDFRFQPDMLTEPPLSQLSGRVDVLYLDNTYCSPDCVFPTRDEAITEIIDIVQRHPYQNIVIGVRSLGKEDLLTRVALESEEWISVPAKLYQTLQMLKLPDVFKCDDSDCRIRVVQFHIISNRNMDRWNEEAETIAILPTALYRGIGHRPFENQSNVFVVPYSDHSSYTELKQFVSFLQPAKICPVVPANARGPFGESVAHRADMSQFSKYLNGKPPYQFTVPSSVNRYMRGRIGDGLAHRMKGKKRKAQHQLIRQGSKKSLKMGVQYEECLAMDETPKAALDSVVSSNTVSNEKTNSVNSSKPKCRLLDMKKVCNKNETYTISNICTGSDVVGSDDGVSYSKSRTQAEILSQDDIICLDDDDIEFCEEMDSDTDRTEEPETVSDIEETGKNECHPLCDTDELAGHGIASSQYQDDVALNFTIQESQGFDFCENTSTPAKVSHKYTVDSEHDFSKENDSPVSVDTDEEMKSHYFNNGSRVKMPVVEKNVFSKNSGNATENRERTKIQALCDSGADSDQTSLLSKLSRLKRKIKTSGCVESSGMDSSQTLDKEKSFVSVFKMWLEISGNSDASGPVVNGTDCVKSTSKELCSHTKSSQNKVSVNSDISEIARRNGIDSMEGDFEEMSKEQEKFCVKGWVKDKRGSINLKKRKKKSPKQTNRDLCDIRFRVKSVLQ